MSGMKDGGYQGVMTTNCAEYDGVEKAECTAVDRALAAAAGLGDRVADRRLIKRVLPRVRKTVHFLAQDRTDADDFAQQALLEILRSAVTFRGECGLDYWADRVTVQTLAKQFERRKRRRGIRDRFWMAPKDTMAVDEQVALTEARERLRVHFGELPERLRMPVVLHYVHGYDVSEIAEIVEAKVNTVRGRLRDGLRRLRKKVRNDPTLREWMAWER